MMRGGDVARAIKRLRERSWTTRQIADACDVSESTVGKWESGRCPTRRAGDVMQCLTWLAVRRAPASSRAELRATVRRVVQDLRRRGHRIVDIADACDVDARDVYRWQWGNTRPDENPLPMLRGMRRP